MKQALIIEDQKLVRESISELLQQTGCKVRLIGDRQAALKALDTTHFDLITLDLNIPSLDGISLIETLSSREGPNNSTSIIVISVYLTQETKEVLLQFGIQCLLSKPFDSEDFLIQARKILTIS